MKPAKQRKPDDKHIFRVSYLCICWSFDQWWPLLMWSSQNWNVKNKTNWTEFMNKHICTTNATYIHHVRNNQQQFSLASFVGPPDFNLNPKRLPPSKTQTTSRLPTPTLPRALPLGFGGPANKNLQISTRIRTTDQFCSSRKNKQVYPPPPKIGDGCQCFSKGVFADGCANPLSIHLLQQARPYQSVKETTTVKALPLPHNESRRRPRYMTQHNVSCS